MSGKLLKMLLAASLVCASIQLHAQTTEAAEEGNWPLVVGVGYSNFHTDWSGRLSGGTFWADWNFRRLPGVLKGVGLEVEGRDLNLDRTGADPLLRMDTISGGPIYTVNRTGRLRPYGKFLIGFGSIDFTLPGYHHDTRTIYAPGVGTDYRLWNHFAVRGDFEYQFWNHFVNDHTLDPYGFTVGIDYDFLRRRRFVGLSNDRTTSNP